MGGEGFATDASTIQADANWERSIPGTELHHHLNHEQVTRLVKEYLDSLDQDALQGPALKKNSVTDPYAR